MLRRTGSAPVASSSRSNGSRCPSPRTTCRALTSSPVTWVRSCRSMTGLGRIPAAAAASNLRAHCRRDSPSSNWGGRRGARRPRDIVSSPVESLAAQHLGCRKASGAAADDDDAPGVLPLHCCGLLVGGSALVAYKHLAVTLLHAPARHRIERRCGNGFAGAQAETGVVPRAADRVADHQALGQRPAVVRASRADGEEFFAPARQKHGVIPNMPGGHAALGNFAERDTLGEVRPLRL